MENTKGKVFSGLIWKLAERLCAQLISLLVSIVLARLLTPSDYGAVALVMVFIAIANVFVSNGMGTALIQKKDADNLDFSSVFYCNLMLSVGIYIVIFCLAPRLADFYDLPVIRLVMRVLGIRIIVAAVNSVQQAYVARHMLFKRFFWSTLFGTLISGIVGVIMAYHGYGVWALVAQYITNTCTDTVVLWFTVRWRPILACSYERVKKLFSFGWKVLVSGLLDVGYNQIRNLLIGKIYSKEDLAFYNQGDKYPSLIVTNVNASISSVLFPALANYQNDKKAVLSITRKSIQVGSFVMWPLMVGLGVCAEPMVRLILTEKWLPCVPYLRIFCFTYGLWPIHTANLQAINAIGRSDLFLKLEIVKKTMGIALLILAIKRGPLAIAGSLVIVGIASTFINAWPNITLLGYTYRMQINDMIPSLILSCIMGCLVFPISKLQMSSLLILVLQVTIGGFLYILLSYLTKQSSLEYLYSLIMERKGRKNG